MSGSNSGQTANSSSWVIVDDWRRLVNGGGWNRQTNAENAFNGTLSTLRGSRFNDNTTSYVQPPSFRGREIMLVGRPSEDLRMGYSIFYSADGSVYAVNEPAQVNTSASVVGKDGAVIWRLDNIPVPSLESGGSFPVIRVYPTQGVLHLDYVAYRLASEEVERLDNVLLDDTHPYIEYDAREADVFIRDDNASTPIGFPLNGTWTRSNRAGSSFTTRFKGAFNVAVYGVLRHTRGTLSLNYTLDNGVTETKNYFDSTQAANATKWSFQKLYEHSFPRDQRFKNHKLEVTLAACTDDQTFYLDYITYQASDHQQSTIPPSESDIGGDDDRGFSKASIGAIVGAIVGFIFFIAVSFRFVKLRRWQIQKRNAAQSGLNYQEPRSYALQALEQRRRQDEMMGPDHRVPDPPPPWTPPANPDGAPPPPEFEPPPASDLFPMPTPRVRLASTIAPGPALEAPPVFESRPSSPAPSAPSETQPTVTNVLQGGRGPGSQGGTLVHSGGGTQAAQATNDIPAPPATPPRSNTS